MAVVVTVGTVDTGKTVYKQGEVVTGLKKEEEQELIDLGVAELSEAPSKSKTTKEEVTKKEGE